MITKGVVSKKLTKSAYEVDIPALVDYDIKSTETTSVCSVINNNLSLKSGDIVFIDFENNRSELPVILGIQVNDKFNNIDSDVIVNSSSVSGVLKFPQSTSIGEATRYDLEHLSGLTGNIQDQVNNIDKEYETAKTNIEIKNSDIKTNNNVLNELNNFIEELNAILENIKRAIGTPEDDSADTVYGRYNSISNKINNIKILLGDIPDNKTAVDLINDSLEEIE